MKASNITTLSQISGLIYLFAFGLAVFAGPNLDTLLRLAEERYGTKGKNILIQWQQMLETAKSDKETAKLVAVNDFFNQRIVFSTDQRIWGSSDYWATPLETMGLRTGDCEDFSIAKYISLLKLGVPMKKLRLTYVKAKLTGGISQAHMVLAYYPTAGADPLILDNLSFDIRPAASRPDLTPVFSFNSEGLWVGGASQPKVKKPETRLSRWRDLLVRMQAEGIQ